MRLLEFSKRSYKFTEITRSRSSKHVAGQEPSHASAKIGDDLWGQAYQKLTKENKHLVERYEQILFEEEKAVAGNHLTVEVETITSSPGRLTALAKAKLDAFENSKLSVSHGFYFMVCTSVNDSNFGFHAGKYPLPGRHSQSKKG